MLRITVALLLVGFASAQAQTQWSREILLGRWYSESIENAHAKRQVISDRHADGSYSIESRIYEGCVLKQRGTETGTWQFDGKVYVKHVLTISGAAVDYTYTYEFTELTDRAMRYWHRESDYKSSALKVDAQFQFPGCAIS